MEQARQATIHIRNDPVYGHCHPLMYVCHWYKERFPIRFSYFCHPQPTISYYFSGGLFSHFIILWEFNVWWVRSNGRMSQMFPVAARRQRGRRRRRRFRPAKPMPMCEWVCVCVFIPSISGHTLMGPSIYWVWLVGDIEKPMNSNIVSGMFPF